MERKPDAATLLAFGSVVLFFGVNFVAVRFSNRELAPFWGAGLRFVVASLILFAIVAARRIPLPRGAALGGAAAFGALSFGANFAFLYTALQTVPAGVASVAFATIPLLTFVVALAAGLERFGWRPLIGAIIALAGIAIVFREQLAIVPLVPLLLVLGGGFSGACAAVIIKRAPRSHPIATNAVGMAVGAAILLALAALARETPTLPTLGATWGALAWLVASSCIGFVLLVWVIGRWTATASSYTAVLAPLVTVTVALWLAGEPVTMGLLAGGALVLVGVYVGVLSGGAPTPPTKAATPPVTEEEART